jgi:hypothetical protein
VVFSNPLGERHEEFNDWYTHVHIRDVMRMPASIAVQRFTRVEDLRPGSAYRYLAIYETDDTAACTAAHAVAMTPKLPISETFDLASPAHYFRLRAFLTADPVADRNGDAVIAEFEEPAGFDLSAAARRIGKDGILSAAHFGALGDQLIPGLPARRELAIFRLSQSDATLRGFQLRGVVPDGALLTHYRALIPRLSAAAVLDASTEERALEAKAREALGDRQHRFEFKGGIVRDRHDTSR